MNTKKLLIMFISVVLFVALVCGLLFSIPTSMHVTKVSAKIDSKQLTDEEQSIIDEAVLKEWKDGDVMPTTVKELTSSATISPSGDTWYYLNSDVNFSNTSATTISGGHTRILLNGYSLSGTGSIKVTSNGTLSLFDRIPNQTGTGYTYNENTSESKTNIPLDISSSTINVFGITIENNTYADTVMINTNSATINLANSTVQSITNKNISNITVTVRAIIEALSNDITGELELQGREAQIFSLTNENTFRIGNSGVCTIKDATGNIANEGCLTVSGSMLSGHITNRATLNVSGSVQNVTNGPSAVVKIIDNNASIKEVTGSGTLEIEKDTSFTLSDQLKDNAIKIANHGNLIVSENVQVPNKIENTGALTINKGASIDKIENAGELTVKEGASIDKIENAGELTVKEGASVDNLSQQKGSTAAVNGEIKNLDFVAGEITLASPGKLPAQVTIPQDGTLKLEQGTSVDKIENNQGGTLIVEGGAKVDTIDSSGTTSIKGDVGNVVVNDGHTTIGDHANVTSAELNQGVLEINKDANLANLGHNNQLQGTTLIDNRITPIIEQRANINFLWIFICLAAAILLLLTILIIVAILKKHKEYTYSDIIDIKTAQYAKHIQYNKNQNVLL